MKSHLSWLPSISFLSTAAIVTFAVTSSLTLNLFPSITLSTQDEFKQICLAVVLTLNIVSLFYSGFSHAIGRGRDHILKDDHVMLASIGVVQAGVIGLSIIGRMTPVETLLVVSAFQIWGTFLFFAIISDVFGSTKKHWPLLPHAAAIAQASFVMLAYPLRNWFPVTSLIENSIMWQSSITLVGIISYSTWIAWSPGSKLNQRYIWQSLKVALESPLNGMNRMNVLYSGVAASLINLCLAVVPIIFTFSESIKSQDRVPTWTIAGFSFLVLPSLMISWGKIRQLSENHAELAVSSKLAGRSAERFLRKNLRDENTWAASIGLRTSVYTIDHDPDDALSRTLPASLIQIRSEEISRCINDVLEGRTLHTQASGQRIVGALDPDLSLRPCIDIIKMFAAMYLDAGPLIERRINGLSTLLPIINPGLANVLRSNNLTELLKRAQWFFHFDYKWVDQNLINTPQTTRYGVHMDPLANELRHAMIAHLRKSNALGSFLWMGRDAQARLLQEAPMLAPIIEPVTITGVEGGDHLVFTLKFENLIPRLQRYFELDKLRNVLMDYEISADAGKLINIFKVQSTQSHTPEAMLNLIESVSSYPWRGFKEKDQALKLVLFAHQYTSRLIHECTEKDQPISRVLIKLRESVQANVEKIGYPSQILHLAQMHKIALRDILNLLKSAKNPTDSRFDESWTLLGNLDLTRYPRAERKLISDFLSSNSNLKSLLVDKKVQSRAIDAMVNLAKCELQIKDYTFGLDSAMTQFIDDLQSQFPTPETLTILLDGMTFLSDLSGRVIPAAESNAQKILEGMVTKFENTNLPFSQALGNRWLERKQRLKSAA